MLIEEEDYFYIFSDLQLLFIELLLQMSDREVFF